MYLQAVKIHTSALWTELMELKNTIKQASQETGIDNGLLLYAISLILIFIIEESQSKHQVIALLDKCKSCQLELKEMEEK